jgi:hypothetical protein
MFAQFKMISAVFISISSHYCSENRMNTALLPIKTFNAKPPSTRSNATFNQSFLCAYFAFLATLRLTSTKQAQYPSISSAIFAWKIS